jgi:hypothetical protein
VRLVHLHYAGAVVHGGPCVRLRVRSGRGLPLRGPCHPLGSPTHPQPAIYYRCLIAQIVLTSCNTPSMITTSNATSITRSLIMGGSP